MVVALLLLNLGCAPEPAEPTEGRLRWLAPADGDFLAEFEAVSFSGELLDPWRAAATVDWTLESDVAGELTGAVETDGTRFTLHFGGGLEPTQHRFVLRATDGEWSAEAHASSIVVSNARPYAALLAPAPGVVVPLGEPVAVVGDFDDPETEDASTITLQWTGDAAWYGAAPATPAADGTVGFKLADLPAGEHTLTVRATDRHGKANEAATTFTVE